MPEIQAASGASPVRELVRRDPPALVNSAWAAAFPWLIQGTTTRGAGREPFDLGLFTAGSSEDTVRRRWRELGEALGMEALVHARQPHSAEVRVWEGMAAQDAMGDPDEADPSDEAGAPGRLVLLDPCDGHATDRPGALLAVTTADCVPVFVVDPVRRAVAVLHAGWRGAAAGIVEAGIGTMVDAFSSRVSDLHVHLGPAICGDCYEVGPEVFEALGRPVPAGPGPIDLRVILFQRVAAAGVVRERVHVSRHCTLCGGSGLYSHRGGDPHRQVGYIGLRL